MWRPDGTQIKSTWEEDHVTGDGVIIDKDGGSHQATFYRDLEIVLEDQNSDCFNLFPLNLALCLITLILIFYCVTVDDYGASVTLGIFAGFFYIGMLAESFCGRTYSFLSHISDAHRAAEMINGCRANPPNI
mmetsp:Transcript_14520/g.14128  ORF Transcript_14520/g.14128 Transcript_14520/m.14128 type:complete len:132 (+) Transcript_14520:431-826(+)